jgi:hypothetical protein
MFFQFIKRHSRVGIVCQTVGWVSNENVAWASLGCYPIQFNGVPGIKVINTPGALF